LNGWIGRTLSKVRLLRRIGRGGMADVYLGEHLTLHRPVAVKILNAHFSEDPYLLARFQTEARAVAALRHPNILQVFDFDVIDGRPYIVMEFINGFSLEGYLEELRQRSILMQPEQVASLIRPLAAALDYAHEQGVLHRDIKPANVMLRCSGPFPEEPAPLPANCTPVLMDFGLARIGHNPGQTTPGTIMGTPAYMSPEQAQGQEIDGRSDVYSLGVMAYQMLTGRPPFEGAGSTPASILFAQVHTPPPMPLVIGPAVRTVLQRALAKRPDDRYPSAGAMAAALDKAVTKDAAEVKRPRFALPRLAWIGIIGLGLAGAMAGMCLAGGLVARALPRAAAAAPSQVASDLTSTPLSQRMKSPPAIATATAGKPVAQASTPLPKVTATPLQVNPTAAVLEPTMPAAPGAQDVRDGLDLNHPDYLDTFDNPALWTHYDIAGKSGYRIADGQLIGIDHVPEERYTWWSLLSRESGNVYAEVEATNGDCLGLDSVGLTIRVDGASNTGGYSLEVSCDGQWRVRRHRNGDDPRVLVNWTPSAAIHTGMGATNRLGIFASYQRFVLFINDVEVGKTQDPEYARSIGDFALFVRASQTYDLQAWFDNFAYWNVRYVP
jgi:hypothetical protein